jgi:hypothetical protein
MKPVEIEFLIKNLTKKSLDEISSDVGRVGKDGKESAGTVSAEFQKLQQQSRVLKDVISGLEAKVSELRAMEAGGPDITSFSTRDCCCSFWNSAETVPALSFPSLPTRPTSEEISSRDFFVRFFIRNSISTGFISFDFDNIVSSVLLPTVPACPSYGHNAGHPQA